MDPWRSFLVLVLHLLFVVELIETNRRPPLRPPPWRNQPPPLNQHHGRGGMPIPIHGENFAQRRIYNGPPPPGGPGPNKFPPPMRNKLPPPPPGYFNKQRRPPPPPPPYGGGSGGGFNQFMRPPPPVNNGPPLQSYNTMKSHMPPAYSQHGHGDHSMPSPPPTMPSTHQTLPSPLPTHQYHQQQMQQHQHHQHQSPASHSQQPQQQVSNQFQLQQQQQQSQYQNQMAAQAQFQQQQAQQQAQQQQQQQQQQQVQQQHSQMQQQPTQNQLHSQAPSSQNQWSQGHTSFSTNASLQVAGTITPSQQTAASMQSNQYNTTPQVIGTIVPSQQTAQSNQYMTVVKPDAANPQSSQPQIYQFHLPPSSNQQPNSIIQIHLSSTTEAPKNAGRGKDYFSGSTFRPPKYDQPQTYPNTEYLPYEKPKSTPTPPLNFKEMNSEKAAIYERPVIYKNSKEDRDEQRPSYKSHYTKPGGQGQPIEFTTESPVVSPSNTYAKHQHKKAEGNNQYEEDRENAQSSRRQDYVPAKPDYEHALTPPSKHDFGMIPPSKNGYGPSTLAKHDYEYYKNFKDYTSKYSQLDPLYHPDSAGKSSTEEDADPELSLPERYDNSFSANYKHDDPPPEDPRYKQVKKRPQGPPKPQPQPEEILSALGLSTNPLDHVDIVKTANEKYKKEPLYSIPDRQIEEDDEEDDDSREVGYPGTGYSMPEKGGSSANLRIHPVKKPAPPEMTHPPIKGLSPPSLGSHVPDHRDDIITADSSNEFWRHPPKVEHREDTPSHYGRYPSPADPHFPQAPRYPGPAPSHYPYGQHGDYGHPTVAPPSGYHPGPSGAPPHYHGPGPTGQPYAHPIYVTEPDPIIEIIVQDSNVTLPPPPRPKPTTPAPVTPEPVHVFYVRYSNNNNKTIIGSASENQNLRLEPPVPAVAVKGPDGHFRPPPNYQQFGNQYQPEAQASIVQPTYLSPNVGSHYNAQQHRNQQAQAQASHFSNPSTFNGQQPPFGNPNNPQQQHPGGVNQFAQIQGPSLEGQSTTTMRAIIRLDKNEFDSSQLKVAFDPNINPFSHLLQQQQQQQQVEPSQQYSQSHVSQSAQPDAAQGQQQLQNQQMLQQLQQQFQQLQQNSQPQQPPQQNTNQFPSSHQFGHQPHHQQFQAASQPHQSPQFSSQLTQQFQSPSSQFQHQQFSAAQIPQASNQGTQFQQPQQLSSNAQFQHHQQPQDVHHAQPPQQNTQFQLPTSQGQEQAHENTASSQQVNQFQVVGQSQNDAAQFSNAEQGPTPTELDFNMDPVWTNWNQPQPNSQQQQQQNQNQHVQQQQQQNVQNQNDQNTASSNTHSIMSPPQPQTSSGGYNPLINYGGGEPLGLSGFHAIGSENSMRYDNPIGGMRPPPGPVYPKLGSFQKRIGLDDLATLLGEESVQQQQQIQNAQQQSQQHQQQPETEISATYHDPDQEQVQQQLLKATQQLHQQQNAQQQQYSDQEKMSKLPDDVPEELKKQLLESGILGNADVQVINYDQNMFKDLTNLPPEAIESFQQNDDIAKLLSSATASRSVRSILVVNEANKRSLRPKRKEASNKLLLFIEDQKTLIYNVKDHSLTTVQNKFVQNAIDYTHHKNN